MGIIEQLAEIKHQEGLENAVRNLFAKSEFSPERLSNWWGLRVSW